MSNTKVRVGFQGMSGCYSEGAAIELFGTHPHFANTAYETVPFFNFQLLFNGLQNDAVEYALVPIENSHSGTLHNVYDLLTKNAQIFITGEYIYHEQHCLLALPSVKLEDIQEVRSHPHVLEQCEEYLTKLGSKVSKSQAEDTAGSASYIQANQLKNVAAIAGKRAAQIYGLEILASEIEDDKNCSTRYLLLSKKAVIPERHANPKTSFVIALKNAPGHLYKALSCFALRYQKIHINFVRSQNKTKNIHIEFSYQRDINVSKLESRPSARAGSLFTTSRPWEYLMYVDIEGSIGDTPVKNAVKNLEEFVTSVRMLGSYPRFQPVQKGSALGPFGM